MRPVVSNRRYVSYAGRARCANLVNDRDDEEPSDSGPYRQGREGEGRGPPRPYVSGPSVGEDPTTTALEGRNGEGLGAA